MKFKLTLIEQQRALTERAQAEGRELTEQEQQEFDALQRMLDRCADEGDDGDGGDGGDGGDNSPNGGERSLEAALTAERNRVREITDLCRSFGLGAEQERSFIDSGASIADVNAEVLKQLRKESKPVGARACITDDAHDKFVRAAADALRLRSGMDVEKPAEGASELRYMSLRDMAIEAMGVDGQSVAGLNRMSGDELFNTLQRQFYNPTAAFPSMLDTAIEKSYVEGHKKVGVTFDRWTSKGSLKDFKTHDNNYLAGPAPEFLEVPEGGELKHSTVSDEKLPTRKLHTYGRQFTLTRQAFINDDIGLVTSVPARYAAAARKTINKQVYQILINNPTIYDGVTLFHATHKNLIASGTGITEESIQAIFMTLQKQTDQFGEAIIIRPAYIIVPVGYAFKLYSIFQSPTINTSGNTQAANPLWVYRNSIEIVEDPTINNLVGAGNAMPWFVVGDKSDTSFIQVDYLNGQEVPNIRRMETPGTLGFVWDIYLDWGISVQDFRGAVKNPGVTLS